LLASRAPSAGPCLSDEIAVAYVEGVLDDARRDEADRHMDRCTPCRWLVSALARQSTAAAASRDATAPAAPPDSELVPGTRVDRYEILRRVGAGGMGAVYAARDPELARDVALKVMTTRAPSSRNAQARMLREAQAMARLSHPNVVPIYDVGPLGDGVFLAMKLVDGLDARRWLAGEQPSWRVALAVLAGAGRGLAAAHASGIVHRDVKPANILIGADRHAWVTDFGLARTAPGDAALDLDDTVPDTGVPLPRPDPGAASRPDPGAALTHTGAVLGTPSYMAPEQHLARPADARSDQFSFCVLLYEAVYREHPFVRTGDTRDAAVALTADVLAGRVRPQPPRSPVPGWLRRMLLRGLSVEPAARWPSIAALLDAIERRRKRPRVIATAGAAALALGLAFGVGTTTRGAAEDDCAVDAAPLIEMALDRGSALSAVAGLGDYGRSLVPRLDRQLADHTSRWLAGSVAACRAQRAGESAGDRQMACLVRTRQALTAATDLLRTASPASLPDDAVPASTLPDPAACGESSALLANVARPRAEIVAQVAGVAAQVERARVLDVAGRYEDAKALATTAVESARALGYRPLLAEALAIRARAMMDQRDWTAADVFDEAMAIAHEVGDDSLTVETWARRAYIHEVRSDTRSTTELDGRALIDGLVRRDTVSAFARALFHNNLGAIANSRGDRVEARRHLRLAVAEAGSVGGHGALELVNARINLALNDDDRAQVGERLADAINELRRLLGDDHPRTILVRMMRGVWLADLARVVETLPPACASYESRGSRETVSDCWTEAGFARDERGDRAGAITAMERAARFADAPEARGYLAIWRGDLPAATQQLVAAIAKQPPDPSETVWSKLLRGKLELALGRAQRAIGDPRALATLARAIADLDAASEGVQYGVVLRRRARAHAEHARALSATGGAAAAPARTAAELLRSEGGRPDEIAELERLAAR
jgi:eukaryotic-like serine/threonine-protein kinase